MVMDGRNVSRMLPGLLCADDIVLTLGLRFSAQKCAVLRWGCLGGRTESEPVTLLGKDIPFLYHRLGVQLSTGPDCLAGYEHRVREKALRGQRVLKAFGRPTEWRLALLAHGTPPNEAVQGDVEWSSFEAPEAVTKKSFEVRARTLGEERQVHRTQKCPLYTGAATRWTRESLYAVGQVWVPLPVIDRQEETSMGWRELREQVSAAETRM
ncbi:hypothetical protein HPB47_004139 [Ixodes persulcatus]|uniref:Uncharacterized protein n=1 Tax=Ixodes persulcatus TaxID=34615 RepID=A0AC60PGK2_IXOPE|nr:hypothetical protein HPB47_004139 [Ixodes persulcatus]